MIRWIWEVGIMVRMRITWDDDDYEDELFFSYHFC